MKVDAHDPAAVNAVADMYDAKTVDSSPETATFEITGARQKINAAVETFSQFGIREISRGICDEVECALFDGFSCGIGGHRV